MAYELILTEAPGRVGIVTLSRPDRLNAFFYQLFGEARDQIGS